jgi:hypothetical protein
MQIKIFEIVFIICDVIINSNGYSNSSSSNRNNNNNSNSGGGGSAAVGEMSLFVDFCRFI